MELNTCDTAGQRSAPVTTSRKLPPALWALTISAFAIGTTEFVAVGILPTIADSMQVTISSAGFLVTVYALGVAIGGPILTAFTSHLPRKPLMLSLLGLFIVCHIGSSLATNFSWLLVTRFISGFAHATFFGVGATIATSLVDVNKKATAIAIMFTGLTFAIVLGVPFGTFIGQHFGWRSTFIGVALLGLASLIATALLLPTNLKQGKTLSIWDQFQVLRNKQILIVFAITAFGYGGTFVVFTYSATLLQQITGFQPAQVSILLLIYGIAIALGNMIGGKLGNTHPARVLIKLFILQSLVLFIFTGTMDQPVWAVITLFAMGLLSFAAVPGLQLYVVQMAEKHLPGTEDISSAFNIAAFNLGVAMGAYAGGVVIDTPWLGLGATPWVGSILVMTGGVITWISYRSNLPTKQV